MNTFHYNADCKQPDPEIWGGGAAGGPLVLASNLNESFSRIYNNEITIPNSATGVISIYGAFIVKAPWVGIATHTISGYIDERRSYSYSGDAGITISGSAVEKFISSDDITAGSLETEISSAEKVTYDYNLDSNVAFSTSSDGLISDSITETIDYGNILDVVTQGNEDYGSTQILSETLSAIGDIVLSGEGSYSAITDDVNTILLRVSGSLLEGISWDPPENVKVYVNDTSSVELTFDNINLTFDSTETKPDIKVLGSAESVFVSFNPPESNADLISSGQLIEKKTIHYNESSATIFEPDPYGLVSDPITQTLDYGLVSSPVSQGEEDQGLIIFAESNTPFGTASFSGSAFVRPPADIKTYNTGADYAVSYNPPENTAYLLKQGNIEESVVFDYNTDSVIPFEIEDMDAISVATSITDDYGLVSDLATIFIDYDSVAFGSGDGTPFGLFAVSGSAEVEYTDKNFYSDTPGAEVKVVYSPAEGEGSLFGVGGISENVVFSYNEDSEREFVIEDSQSISGSVTIVDDYGLVTDAATIFDDYALVDELFEGSTPFGLFTISGSAEVEVIDTNNYGEAQVKFVYSPDDTSGTLFGFGQKVESVTYDYTEDSVLVVGVPNYGFIGVGATVIEDYGVVSDIHTQSEDIGSILGFSAGGDVFPYGIITLSGSGVDRLDSQTPENTINITLSGNGLESFTPQTEVGSGILSISGSSDVPLRILNEVGTGSLFGFGEKLESVSYDYTLDSTIGFTTESSGSISDVITISLDYGFVSDVVSQGQEDYSTVILGDETGAFGSISIVGSADLREIKIYEDPLLKIYRFIEGYPQTGLNTSSFVGVAFSDRGPGVGAYSGFNIDRHINFVGAGGPRWAELLPLDLARYESITISAIRGNTGNGGEDPEPGENLLLQYKTVDNPTWITIGTIVAENDPDFQTLNDVTLTIPDGAQTGETTLRFFQQNSSGPQFDNYAITQYVLTPRVGIPRLFTFSGNDLERTIVTPPINEKPNLFLDSEEVTYDSSVGTFDVTEQPDIKLTGSSEFSPVIYREIGGGSMFNISESDIAVTYDYNEESILPLINEDSGSVSDPTTTIVDYGFVYEELTAGEEDGGLVEDTAVSGTPFGLFNVSGTAGLVFIDSKFYDDINVESKVRVAYSPDDTTGTLFTIDGAEESVVYDYSLDSAREFVIEDSSSIDSPVTITNDYGFITDTPTSFEDYSSVQESSEGSVPFGSTTISGSAVVEYRNVNVYAEGEVRRTFSPDDTSGTLFGFGEKLESTTFNYNDESVFFVGVTDSGDLVSDPTILEDHGSIAQLHEREEDLLTLIDLASSEDIYPFGTFSILGSAEVDATFDEVSTGLFDIYGSAVTDYTPKYTGVGTLNISGTSIVKFTSSEVATDDIVVSGTKSERRTKSYNESSILTLGEQVLNYGSLSTTTELSADYGSVAEIATENSEELGSITSGIVSDIYPFGTITISGDLDAPDIDLTPKYTGSGLITISGSALESETEDFGSGRRRGGNIRFCGDATYSETDSYVGFTTNPITLSGTLIEKETDSYVGLGTIFVSDRALERDAESYVGLGTATFSGTALEAYSAQTPEGTQLFTFYGELRHPDIDLTPHYGIEKNIGVGTTGIQLSGTAVESESEAYAGVGTISVVNGLSPEEFYPWLPTGIGRSWSFTKANYTGGGSITLSTGVPTRTYSPIYPRNALIGDPGSGTGLIRINDDKQLAFTRAVLPIFAEGTIYIVGVGSEGQFDVGGDESFTPATYIASGQITISGTAPSREVDVFQDYVTTGLFTISSQTAPIIEKTTFSEVGIGTIFVSDTIVFRETNAYDGTGTILAISGGAEAYSAQTPEDTAKLQISGSAQESFVAQTPEDTVLYTFSGQCEEDFTPSPDGSGTIFISGTATERDLESYSASGTFRFVKHTCDQTYDTCDSDDIYSDEIGSARESFTANTPEDTVLFNIDGSATTAETALYTKVATGLFALSGTFQDIKLTNSESGIGTIFLADASASSERDAYVGSGSLFAISSSDSLYSADTPENTVILQISGSAITSVESDFFAVGVGLFNFNGSAVTSEINSYPVSGSGTITLSGELVHPDVIFLPAPKGSGTINILGSSTDSLTKAFDTTGVLFTFSGGFESFTKSTYIGVGTIYSQDTPASTINNPYQIPRSYVCII
jgi:hypothetical protein